MARPSTSRLSLEDWDSLSPLSASETASIARVTEAASKKALPTRLQDTLKANGSRPATPLAPGRKQHSQVNLHLLASGSPTSSPRPLSAASMRGTTTASDPRSLEILEPIATTQQFHDWFTRVEASLEREQEEIYRLHLGELDEYIDSCEGVLEGLDDARGLVQEMEANYRFVEENSRALQVACETMLDEQKHLVEVSEAIGARLEYFRELETATKMLNLPGEELVLQEDFLNMLDRLDVCLDYLKANRDFKDAEIYLIRFQQCLTRSMTLIKMYFVSTIRKLTAEVAEKMAGKDLSETALQALLFDKFSSSAPTLRILLLELEKRARVDPSEYGALLSECYTVWFASRSSLISPRLGEEVRRMDPGGSEVIKLARAGCNHLRGICMAEWALYKELFSTGEDEAYQFLESLCDNLYDSLRPRILHEPRLETLCELCTVLSAMMALDSQALGDEDEEDDDLPPAAKAERMGVGRLRFAALLRTIQQDAQTRLVFRAQAVIQSEVLHFVPSPEDLKYPEKVEEVGEKGLMLWTEDERMRDLETERERERERERGRDARSSKEGGGFRVPREEVQGSWYPTLKRTVWVLSRLNTYVNNAIFEDFAGEAVTLCRQSLSAASTLISARSPPDSKIDGQLFLIRHLLLLKEMIRSVDLVQIERAADFSSVTDALVNLLKNSSVIFNPNALFELASKGIPNFAETMTDAKTDLDSALKLACESLISDSSSRIASLIRSFLDRCTSFLSSPGSKDLPGQSWATPEEVIKLHDEFQKGLDAQAQAVVSKLRVYLGDEKTIGVLLPPLLDEIVEAYTTFYNLTRSEYGFATSSSLLAPAEVKKNLQEASK